MYIPHVKENILQTKIKNSRSNHHHAFKKTVGFFFPGEPDDNMSKVCQNLQRNFRVLNWEIISYQILTNGSHCCEFERETKQEILRY